MSKTWHIISSHHNNRKQGSAAMSVLILFISDFYGDVRAAEKAN